EPAQKIEVRAAAFETPCPEPHLIGKKERHPALALARENEQRFSGGAGQNAGAVHDLGINLAEPFAPGGWLLIGAWQAASHRMFGALFGDRGAEGVLGQAAVRARRSDSPQRRVIEPF